MAISETILGQGTVRALPAWDNNCIKSSCVGQNRIRFPFARAELGVVLLFCRTTKAITFQHNHGRKARVTQAQKVRQTRQNTIGTGTEDATSLLAEHLSSGNGGEEERGGMTVKGKGRRGCSRQKLPHPPLLYVTV